MRVSSQGDATGPLNVTLRRGDRIRPRWLRITPDGELSVRVSETLESGIQIAASEDFRISWGATEKGGCQLGFDAVNLADGEAFDNGEVTYR